MPTMLFVTYFRHFHYELIFSPRPLQWQLSISVSMQQRLFYACVGNSWGHPPKNVFSPPGTIPVVRVQMGSVFMAEFDLSFE